MREQSISLRIIKPETIKWKYMKLRDKQLNLMQQSRKSKQFQFNPFSS